MPRFFLSTPPKNNQAQIEGQEAHHLLNVKRATVGMIVALFDINSIEYEARIVKCSRKKIEFEILSQVEKKSQKAVDFCLAVSLIKAKNWETVLYKSMELGVSKLIPVITEYTDSKYVAGNRQRWQKIILAAAKQCGRSDFVIIDEIKTFAEMLKSNEGLCLVMHNSPHSLPLKAVLDDEEKTDKIIATIGPEGGFSEKEVQLANEAGFTSVSLGRNILRAETAAIVTMANINFYFQ